LCYKGDILFGKDNEKVAEGDILFIPGGKMLSISYGNQHPVVLTNEDFMSNKEKYFGINRDFNKVGTLSDSFGYITFEAKVFDSVNFFASLDIPPFVIRDAPDLAKTIHEVITEELLELPGRGRVIKIKTEEIVVKVIRYILANRLFVEQLATNSTYFKDPRLIDIFAYIKDQLGGDLSNKILASVAI
jgi:hypothetical protein